MAEKTQQQLKIRIRTRQYVRSSKSTPP
uniref:Uncharacterized protein n=1 Tax=Arundo donax TaxID=35708 RepID=A0A0A9ESK8_ARUDO